jgi:hypothetical protein
MIFVLLWTAVFVQGLWLSGWSGCWYEPSVQIPVAVGWVTGSVLSWWGERLVGDGR